MLALVRSGTESLGYQSFDIVLIDVSYAMNIMIVRTIQLKQQLVIIIQTRRGSPFSAAVMMIGFRVSNYEQ